MSHVIYKGAVFLQPLYKCEIFAHLLGFYPIKSVDDLHIFLTFSVIKLYIKNQRQDKYGAKNRNKRRQSIQKND